jgi:hypothetical protein
MQADFVHLLSYIIDTLAVSRRITLALYTRLTGFADACQRLYHFF